MKQAYRRRLPHFQPPEGGAVFVTFCTLDRWFLPERARDIVVRHCLYDDGTKLWMHGFVVMPDHVHLVFTPLSKRAGLPYALQEIMSGIKSVSARNINRALGREGSVWQAESFDHVSRREESLRQKVEYICQNPIRAGLVKDESEYPWLWREWVDRDM